MARGEHIVQPGNPDTTDAVGPEAAIHCGQVYESTESVISIR